MGRLRYNGLQGTLGAALTNVATSITFSATLKHSNGTNVPTIVSPDYIPLVILSPTSGLVTEIVNLTAYTAGATTGTITRGQEGTSGIAHALADPFTHDATAFDFGVGTAYTPTWTGATTPPTLGNATLLGYYALVGPLCFFSFVITVGSTTTIAAGQYSFTMPASPLPTRDSTCIGEAKPAGNVYPLSSAILSGSNVLVPKATPTTAGGANQNLTGAAPAAWAAGTFFRFAGFYFWD